MWAHYTSVSASADAFMSNGQLCGVNGIFSVWPSVLRLADLLTHVWQIEAPDFTWPLGEAAFIKVPKLFEYRMLDK